jgi:hypothetical protein
MRYLLAPLLGLVVLLSFASPAYASIIGPLDPIIPDACKCEGTAPDYGCALQVVQGVIRMVINFAFVLVVFAFVYAGFLYMTSGGSPQKRGNATKLLLNVFIGLAIMLTSWLIVDFVMKTLAGQETGGFGPWNSILADTSGQYCIDETQPQKIATGDITIVYDRARGIGSVPDLPPDPNADSRFTYQPGIDKQFVHASAAVRTMLSCMASRVPPNVGQVSSISDSRIANGSKTFSQCATGGCAHAPNSCHYGGRTCVGSSYAIDFGDENNSKYLISAAKACGTPNAGIHNNNHVHVTVPNSCGCQ